MTRRKSSAVIASLVVVVAAAGSSLVRREPPVAEDRAETPAPAPRADGEAQAVLISTRATNDAASGFAATRPDEANSRSLRELRWTFGSKPQRGWQLYAPLIAELVGSDDPAESLGFASSVARWQGAAGLAPTGVVDEETMMSMVKAWQEKRSPDRTYPTPEQLITAGATEFYDPARVAVLRQVERTTYDAYRRMLRAALSDPSLKLAKGADGELAPGEQRLRIISAFRSREYQEQLRKQSPHSGRAALAVNSPHFTGRAPDLYIAGEPVEAKDSNRAIQVEEPVYRWLVRNAKRFGFRPYFYEPWHWEYDPALDAENKGTEAVRQRYAGIPADGVMKQ